MCGFHPSKDRRKVSVFEGNLSARHLDPYLIQGSCHLVSQSLSVGAFIVDDINVLRLNLFCNEPGSSRTLGIVPRTYPVHDTVSPFTKVRVRRGLADYYKTCSIICRERSADSCAIHGTYDAEDVLVHGEPFRCQHALRRVSHIVSDSNFNLPSLDPAFGICLFHRHLNGV